MRCCKCIDIPVQCDREYYPELLQPTAALEKLSSTEKRFVSLYSLNLVTSFSVMPSTIWTTNGQGGKNYAESCGLPSAALQFVPQQFGTDTTVEQTGVWEWWLDFRTFFDSTKTLTELKEYVCANRPRHLDLLWFLSKYLLASRDLLSTSRSLLPKRTA